MAEQVAITSIIHTISVINEWLDQELRERLQFIGNGDVTTSFAPSFRVLRAADGTLPITQLAERMHRSKPYVTHMVNQMQRSGYFARSKHAEDRRVNSVILTEKGFAVAKEIDDTIAEMTAAQLSIFTPEELGLLAILLGKAARPFLPVEKLNPHKSDE